MLGRAVFLLAALGLLTWQVARNAGDVRDALHEIGVGHATLSLVAALVGLGASGLAWRSIVASLGSPLPVKAVPPVFFVAQIGKYLPGAVWPYLAQVRLGREYGVSGSRSAVSSVLFVLAHCATGGAVAAAVLPWADPDITHRFWWALVIAPLVLLVLHPKVLLPLLHRVHRLARRGTPPERLDGRRLAAALGWLLVTWVCYGASLLTLLSPLAPHGPASYAALSLGGYALAWTVGFGAAAVLVVAAPAGLGFREVVLIAVLSPVLSAGAATAVALVSRIVQTVGDGLWALAGTALAGRAKPRPEAPDQSLVTAPTPAGDR
jgi:glycosyltransferase 2 family protein